MRSPRGLRLAAALTVIFALPACGGTEIPVPPTSTTATPTQEEPPSGEPSVEPTTDLSKIPEVRQASRNFDVLKDVEVSGKGENHATAVSTVESFVVNQMSNPYFLSGQWSKESEDSKGIIEALGVPLSSGLQDWISEGASMQEALTMQSLAAFFTPTDEVEAVPGCVGTVSDLGACLTGDFTVIKATGVYNEDNAEYEFTVSATATQRLLINGEEFFQEFSYDDIIWLSGDGKTVNAVQNSFVYKEPVAAN